MPCGMTAARARSIYYWGAGKCWILQNILRFGAREEYARCPVYREKTKIEKQMWYVHIDPEKDHTTSMLQKRLSTNQTDSTLTLC
jgi:hypothetical protein